MRRYRPRARRDVASTSSIGEYTRAVRGLQMGREQVDSEQSTVGRRPEDRADFGWGKRNKRSRVAQGRRLRTQILGLFASSRPCFALNALSCFGPIRHRRECCGGRDHDIFRIFDDRFARGRDQETPVPIQVDAEGKSTDNINMVSQSKTTNDPSETTDELQCALDRLASGERDPRAAQASRERMDRLRENNRRRLGIQNIAVDLIRAARDSR